MAGRVAEISLRGPIRRSLDAIHILRERVREYRVGAGRADVVLEPSCDEAFR